MEVSNELKQLYRLLKDRKSSNGSDYYYLKWLVMNTERDHMAMLLQQLEKMNKDYKID